MCSKNDINHLIPSLQQHFKISTDFEGQNYCGLTFDWFYENGFVIFSMLGYIATALHKFQFTPNIPQYSPHAYHHPAIGAKVQYVKLHDNLPLKHTKDIHHIQAVAGTFLYYSTAIDPTMIVALDDIATVQAKAKPTITTLKKFNRLMYYAATYPNATLRYFDSYMILHANSNAAYLVFPNAWSHNAGYHILGNCPSSAPSIPSRIPNVPILVEYKTLRNMVASAAEAETGGLFHMYFKMSICVKYPIYTSMCISFVPLGDSGMKCRTCRSISMHQNV